MYSNYSMEAHSSYKRNSYEEQAARERMARKAQAGSKAEGMSRLAAALAQIAQAVVGRKPRHSARPA